MRRCGKITNFSFIKLDLFLSSGSNSENPHQFAFAPSWHLRTKAFQIGVEGKLVTLLLESGFFGQFVFSRDRTTKRDRSEPDCRIHSLSLSVQSEGVENKVFCFAGQQADTFKYLDLHLHLLCNSSFEIVITLLKQDVDEQELQDLPQVGTSLQCYHGVQEQRRHHHV